MVGTFSVVASAREVVGGAGINIFGRTVADIAFFVDLGGGVWLSVFIQFCVAILAKY